MRFAEDGRYLDSPTCTIMEKTISIHEFAIVLLLVPGFCLIRTDTPTPETCKARLADLAKASSIIQQAKQTWTAIPQSWAVPTVNAVIEHGPTSSAGLQVALEVIAPGTLESTTGPALLLMQDTSGMLCYPSGVPPEG